MYTLGAFLGMLCLLAAWRIGVEGERKARWWLLYLIAGITGLSVSNVGFLIHTGIQRLRKRFKATGLIARPEGDAR